MRHQFNQEQNRKARPGGVFFRGARVVLAGNQNRFRAEELFMRRISFHLLSAAALAGLTLLASRPVSAQMMGGMMGSGEQTQVHPMHIRHNRQSMQSMMQQMHGMMGQMHAMMGRNQGMMASQGMSAMGGADSSSDGWPAMMQSMNSMGASMQQMLARMDAVMSNRSMMANPKVRSGINAMRGHMRAMMDSMQGMLHNMRQMRNAGQAPTK